MEKFHFKQETLEHSQPTRKSNPSLPVPVIDLSSSDSDSFDSSSSSSDDDAAGVNTKRSRASKGTNGAPPKKKKKLSQVGVVLPKGFLDPLPTAAAARSTPKANGHSNKSDVAGSKGCMQFWKSGDFEGVKTGDWDSYTGGMDHIRVHPRFLHSNATSHQWVLGAFAELLDNALDEVINGATYVTVDMIKSKKDGSKMLRIEDNGGGMDPDQMRQCMSLGYSLKSKIADTIGQYGNGFKTSTMRLGADVIVFSRCSGKDGKKATQSIGLLSYTFLRSTGKEDIIVPMVDFERSGQEWKKIIRSSPGDWNKNMETMIRWSPFSNEADLLRQFNRMKDQGTSIIVYNLWEDDQGSLELDFEADPHDIQIRGVNRDEKNIQMAKKFPNSRHFLTYKHSLRSYASILYLRIPPGFRVILRGKDVEQHNIVNDMMFTQEVSYRPQPGTDGLVKDSTMVAAVTVGFVKDATAHVDVQGFNVYHKNRLIKPFWRVWNASGSDGRGVIGILEANFVEPAHDKQGFERTIVLSRLEAKLVQMQKTYWSKNCHRIGYAKRYDKNDKNNVEDPSPEYTPQNEKEVAGSSVKTPVPISDKFSSYKNDKTGKREAEQCPKTASNGYSHGRKAKRRNPDPSTKSGKTRISSSNSSESSSSSSDDENDDIRCGFEKGAPSVSRKNVTVQIAKTDSPAKQKDATGCGNQVVVPSDSSDMEVFKKLKEENLKLRERLNRNEEEIKAEMLRDLRHEKQRCKSLDAQVKEAIAKIENLNLEQESLVKLFTEEREQRNTEEENLRKKYKEASNKVQQLIEKVKLLGRPKPSNLR